MPALAAITLADSVPANRVFNPSGKDGSVSMLMTDASVYDAKDQLSVALSRVSANSKVNRLKFRVITPIMDTVDTTKRVAFCQADVSLTLPKEATAVHRADILALVASLTGHATIKTMALNVEDLY